MTTDCDTKRVPMDKVPAWFNIDAIPAEAWAERHQILDDAITVARLIRDCEATLTPIRERFLRVERAASELADGSEDAAEVIDRALGIDRLYKLLTYLPVVTDTEPRGEDPVLSPEYEGECRATLESTLRAGAALTPMGGTPADVLSIGNAAATVAEAGA